MSVPVSSYHWYVHGSAEPDVCMVAVPSAAPEPQDTFVDDMTGGDEQHERTLSNTVEGSS